MARIWTCNSYRDKNNDGVLSSSELITSSHNAEFTEREDFPSRWPPARIT